MICISKNSFWIKNVNDFWRLSLFKDLPHSKWGRPLHYYWGEPGSDIVKILFAVALMILISGFMQRSNGSLPLSHGWHYLSQDKVWVSDPQIVVQVSRGRDPSTGAPCPVETHRDSPHHNLETVGTADLSSCVLLCRSRRACLGLTFNNHTCRLKYKLERGVYSKTEMEYVALNCSGDIHSQAFTTSLGKEWWREEE